MPFVTEEIWQHLRGEERNATAKIADGPVMIMTQPYPQLFPQWIDVQTEQQMNFLMGAVRAIRNLRSEMGCAPGKQVNVIFHGPEAELSLLRAREPYLQSLARIGNVDYRTSGERPKGAATAVVGTTEIYLPLGDMINVNEESARLVKEVKKVEEELARIRKKLSNGDFLVKAKEEVIRKEREKASQCEEKMSTLNRSLERLKEIDQGRN
jgi:valyl-tRNA synthetase